MRTAPIAIVCVLAAAPFAVTAVAGEAAPNTLTAAEKAAGWKLLFDGKTTDGWRGFRQRAFPAKGWVIEDGVLTVQAGGGGGDIITAEQFGEFELSLEFRTAPRANSGIIYRVTEVHGATWQTGPEYQVLDDAGHNLPPDHPHSAAALYDLATPDSAKILRPAGEFNEARVVAAAGRIEHWLNGVKVLEVRTDGQDWKDRIAGSKFKVYEGFGVQPKGHIALQEHGDTVSFRNIKVRDLSAPMPGEVSLFNAKDMSGWKAYLHEGKSIADVWRVENGVMICAGKPAGYIYTEKDYTNFVLRLQWRWNPETRQAGNSGVLLRMIGEHKVWPKSVEAQLHSGNAGDFWNIGDFRMTTDPARTSGRNTRKLAMAERPVGEWNDYEIVVDRGTITLYVNGRLVNQATDVEEVAGKICLQSEGTEIHFRDIRLAPIP